MPDELLFTVDGATATPAEPLSLADAGLKERSDLQEWVASHPQILGPDIKIVTMEFDRWQSAAAQTSDRLDILGLHASGELVIAELKRDKAPDTVEMQAIKYAAMASRFSVETLAEQHARYLTQRGSPTDAQSAGDLLVKHATLTIETLRRPRIVLLASGYPPTTSAAAVWLSEMGIAITLMQYRAYRTGTEISISVSQLYPIPSIEDFTITPRQAEVRAAKETTERRQEVGTVARIVDAEILDDGAELAMRPYAVNADLREQLAVWLEEDPSRGQARWFNDEKTPIEWAFDHQRYTPTTLGKIALRQATGVERALRGGDWFIDPDGNSLVELAAKTQGERAALYAKFWGELLERVREVEPTWAGGTSPPAQSWVSLSCSIPDGGWNMSFARDGRLRSELYFDNDDRGSYSELKASKADFEMAAGGPVTWEDLPARKAARVALYRPGDIEAAEQYSTFIEWFIESQRQLRKGAEAALPTPT